MTIKQIQRGSEIEMFVEGRLDSNTAPEAERYFLQSANNTEKLVLNFAGLQYISSAGLRTIKRVYMSMMNKEGGLYLKAVPRSVMEVLEMTGFSGILNFV